MAARLFSKEEATRLVPTLEEAFETIFFLNDSLKNVSKDIQDLLGIWGEDVLKKSNADNVLYNERLRKKNEIIAELKEESTKIQDLGCVIKDLEKGLIDFESEHNGERLWLCWKYGEQKVEFWHTVEEGFGHRKSIKELTSQATPAK